MILEVQVQEKTGEIYRALETDGDYKLRLVISWNLGFHACDDEGSPNEVSLL